MSQVNLFDYSTTTTGSPGVYHVTLSSQAPTTTLAGSYSPGDTLVLSSNNHEVEYLGGADLNGKEVGFFGLDLNTGKIIFLSTSPLSSTSGATTVKLTLDTAHGYDATCFMAGTAITTPQGLARVEELAIGDLVNTAEGGVAPVKWVGRQTVSSVFGDPKRVLPIRIRAGALADGLPTRDLLVSPCHAILVEGVLVHAGALVNGRSIVRESAVPETFTYYHVELEAHALILAEGVAAETFIDNVDRLAFDNWEEHQRLYPGGRSIPELPHPRAASARQIPERIRRALEARAAARAATDRDAA